MMRLAFQAMPPESIISKPLYTIQEKMIVQGTKQELELKDDTYLSYKLCRKYKKESTKIPNTTMQK